jgi:hypothetical protein
MQSVVVGQGPGSFLSYAAHPQTPLGPGPAPPGLHGAYHTQVAMNFGTGPQVSARGLPAFYSHWVPAASSSLPQASASGWVIGPGGGHAPAGMSSSIPRPSSYYPPPTMPATSGPGPAWEWPGPGSGLSSLPVAQGRVALATTSGAQAPSMLAAPARAQYPLAAEARGSAAPMVTHHQAGKPAPSGRPAGWDAGPTTTGGMTVPVPHVLSAGEDASLSGQHCFEGVTGAASASGRVSKSGSGPWYVHHW